MRCGVCHRRGSDPGLQWLWCRQTTIAPIQPLAGEPQYAASVALKKKKAKKKKKVIINLVILLLIICYPHSHSNYENHENKAFVQLMATFPASRKNIWHTTGAQ